MDVRDEAAHVTLAETAINTTGRLDAWVNNAGVSAWKPINEIDEAFFDELMGINLKGAFWGCKVAARFMKDEGGSIINISSIAGKRGSANNAMYCATKFGMNGLTQSLAKELGPVGIRVNAICPVLVKTKLDWWTHFPHHTHLPTATQTVFCADLKQPIQQPVNYRAARMLVRWQCFCHLQKTEQLLDSVSMSIVVFSHNNRNLFQPTILENFCYSDLYQKRQPRRPRVLRKKLEVVSTIKQYFEQSFL